MKMTRDELKKLKDSLKNVKCLSSLPSKRSQEILEEAEVVINNLLGCDLCQNMKWYVKVECRNSVLIVACHHKCVHISDDGGDDSEEHAILKIATEFISHARYVIQKVE